MSFFFHAPIPYLKILLYPSNQLSDHSVYVLDCEIHLSDFLFAFLYFKIVHFTNFEFVFLIYLFPKLRILHIHPVFDQN
jgi:hypothetical protein